MTLDVLVADHSPFMRRLVAEVLADDHRVVATAENGVVAVELAAEYDPDVVVLDVDLPIRDGVDAAATIVGQASETGVVACTTDFDEERIDEARTAGVAEYVVKPFRGANLLAAVEDAAPA